MKNSDMRIIKIRELEVFAHHGVFEEETMAGQKFFINAKLVLDNTAGQVLSDDLESTVDYGEVCHFITEYMQKNTCKLLEKITELLCIEILYKYPLVSGITLEIRKPEAPIGLPFESVSVERTLSRHIAYLSIGSNMGDKEGHLDRAIALLDKEKHTRFICESERFATEPYGGVIQEDFLNSAVMVETVLSPHELLDYLHEIENSEGRKREVRWGPRTLDLDIVFYDDISLSDSTLTIPHTDMQNRLFVLEPLAKIAGYYRHPVLGRTVSELLKELEARELTDGDL